MAKHFGSADFPLKCLQCEHEFTETVARVETDPEVTCPSCGVVNRYDAKQLREIMRSADKAIDKLRRAMSKFNKSS